MENLHHIFAKKAIILAEKWLVDIQTECTQEENAFQQKMNRLVQNENDKFLLISLMDKAFRSNNPIVVSKQIKQILEQYEMGSFFSDFEQVLVRLFLGLGHYFPHVAVPQIIDKIRSQSSNLIVAGENKALSNYLQNNHQKGFISNINFLGEAILGETEAQNRIQEYLAALKDPDVNYVSIKISTLYAQIHPLAFDESVEIISQRLSLLYSAAITHPYIQTDGKSTAKFVNLDMEEYRDLSLTLAVFTQTLNQDCFKKYTAGIVLQAYIPDSYNALVELCTWATTRVNTGGAPIKIRLVKGANAALEKLESSLKNWELTIFKEKWQTDAQYKKMLAYVLDKDKTKAIKIGVASHNLLEQAYAYELAKHNGVEENLSIELLQGMAPAAARVLKKYTKALVLYAPVVKKAHFINAVAYLVRRLDENTEAENYLSKAFNLHPNHPDWAYLKSYFLKGINAIGLLNTEGHRTQNREKGNYTYSAISVNEQFTNVADTDWVLKHNRKWIIENIQNHNNTEITIPVVIEGEEKYKENSIKVYDKNNNSSIIASYTTADTLQINQAFKSAAKAHKNWQNKQTKEIAEILAKVASNFATHRGDLILTALKECGKVVTESDAEISEAIDFLLFYPHSLAQLSKEGINYEAQGVISVIAPWNFPLAIPTGGIAAALACGNSVVFKPASAAVLCGWKLCNLFWDAGVPKEILQFVPCSGKDFSLALDSSICKGIIFTGSTATALQIYQEFPTVPLYAETGGKNTTIVSPKADRDLAIKNILQSAFSNSGQKCSATSILILIEEVYNDPQFKQALKDATESLYWGSAWDLQNKIGPLVTPPNSTVEKVLNTLMEGESWLVPPQWDKNNPLILNPCIKWNVHKNSPALNEELFCPVLSVIPAKNLAHAIEIANANGYGLTAGIESLDKDEIKLWKKRIYAGNLYINKATTGAIVLRQAFGGYQKSAIGKGLKAGGWNYVSQLIHILKPTQLTKHNAYALEDLIKTVAENLDYNLQDLNYFANNCYHYLNTLFKLTQDYFKLPGEHNHFKYKKFNRVIVRIISTADIQNLLWVYIIDQMSTINIKYSIDEKLSHHPLLEQLKDLNIPFVFESSEALISRLNYTTRLRYLHSITETKVSQYARTNGYYIEASETCLHPRIELLKFYQEQSTSHSYHRYGNLMGENNK